MEDMVECIDCKYFRINNGRYHCKIYDIPLNTESKFICNEFEEIEDDYIVLE